MILKYVEICGFRGFRDLVRFDFGSSFTVIDGRNGVGKSTIFDAIEFALTGTISKYLDAKSAGETVENYLWWNGQQIDQAEPYVEVCFSNTNEDYTIRREKSGTLDNSTFRKLEEALCNLASSPSNPIKQLTSSSIIRDEHITSLSLDIKETDRYALVHGALGAVDADRWIDRAQSIHQLAKQESKSAEKAVSDAMASVTAANQKLDELNAALIDQEVLGRTLKTLQSYVGANATGAELSDQVRLKIASSNQELEQLKQTYARLRQVPDIEKELKEFESIYARAKEELEANISRLAELPAESTDNLSASNLAETARSIVQLIEQGQSIGLQDSHCPLCYTEQSDEDFRSGNEAALELARSLDFSATAQAELEARKQQLSGAVDTSQAKVSRIESEISAKRLVISETMQSARTLTKNESPKLEQLTVIGNEIQGRITDASNGLRILDTLKLNRELERAKTILDSANEALANSQKNLNAAQRAETGAKRIYDSARRARGESVDMRLERVLPLLSEFYSRLHPHPYWDSITHSIRGEVKKFLKLEVGEGLNPQFMFSSGQRRVTGLSFLLAVNMSITWSHWQSILLDDPVQHIDDFRSVHLAEVLSQIVRSGKQVICSVEDPALADMICRRLPVDGMNSAKKITLHLNNIGLPDIQVERALPPLAPKVLDGSSSQTMMS